MPLADTLLRMVLIVDEVTRNLISTFLRGLYDLEPGLFVRKLYEQPEAIGVSAGGRAGQPFEKTSRALSSISAKNRASGMSNESRKAPAMPSQRPPYRAATVLAS